MFLRYYNETLFLYERFPVSDNSPIAPVKKIPVWLLYIAGGLVAIAALLIFAILTGSVEQLSGQIVGTTLIIAAFTGFTIIDLHLSEQHKEQSIPLAVTANLIMLGYLMVIMWVSFIPEGLTENINKYSSSQQIRVPNMGVFFTILIPALLLNRAFVAGTLWFKSLATKTTNKEPLTKFAIILSLLTGIVAILLLTPAFVNVVFGMQEVPFDKGIAISVIIWALAVSIFMLTRYFYRLPAPQRYLPFPLTVLLLWFLTLPPK